MRKTPRKPNKMKWNKVEEFYVLDLPDSGDMWICVSPKDSVWRWDLIGGNGSNIHASKRKFENAFSASDDAQAVVQELLIDWASALENTKRIPKP